MLSPYREADLQRGPGPGELVKLGIRVKFVGILIIATVVPLAVATMAIYFLGNRYYRNSAGEDFRNRAEQMANYLVLSVDGHSESLRAWLTLSPFHAQLEDVNEAAAQEAPEEFRSRIADLEARWPELSENSPEVRRILEGELADALQEFQNISELFSEIFVTDNKGRVVATTNKTTNYWNGNESWWQKGMRQNEPKAYIEGVNYDESARVYSFDLIIPLHDPENPDSPPVGVAKGVLNAAPLLVELAANFAAEETEWKIVLADSTVLFGETPLEAQIQEEVMIPLLRHDAGWMVQRLQQNGKRQIIGFTRLPWRSALLEEGAVSYVLVHQSASTILAPVRQQLLLMIGAGSCLLLLCFLGGLYLAQFHIIRPIRLLQGAARKIAASAKLGEKSHSGAIISPKPENRRLLDKINHIHSQDELGDLARDFRSMAERVLNYHAHLEAEISSKVTEMQGDLVIAREFQEALMPHEYPAVPEPPDGDALQLAFNHIYKPASTVGGDFLNVIKLSEHRAGIFIADVMGHGARSALVTAIVATLLHDLAPKAKDPAAFMTALNQHFHHLIQHSKQVIFVTAFYIVIDTREKVASFASAGHPPPLLVQRRKGQVKPLIHSLQNDTALGLLADSTYTCFNRPITSDDMFLLFTDGLFEVLSPMGEEFGVQKLSDVVNQNLEFSATELGHRILETINRYSGFAAQTDDICLVTVEINAPASAPAPEESQVSSEASSADDQQPHPE